MITTRSLTLATNVMMTIGYHVSGVDSIISFLPLAHIMEQLIFTVCLVFGTQTGFSSGSTNRLLEDIQELHPTYFCAVPRVYEKIYKTICNRSSGFHGIHIMRPRRGQPQCRRFHP